MALVIDVVKRVANDTATIDDKGGAANAKFPVAIHFLGLPDTVLLADGAFLIRQQFDADTFLVAKFGMPHAVVATDAE